MTVVESIILGVIQGVFMFFPVSSTSHLVLTQHWLIGRGSTMPSPESPEMILFDLVVHVGTLISIAAVFHRSLFRFLSKVWEDLNKPWRDGMQWENRLYLKLAIFGMISVAVTGVVGMPMKSAFEHIFAHPVIIACTLTITGVLLYFTDTVGPRPRGLRELTLTVAIVIGFAQCLALMPGLSRSGLTIAFALFIGLKRRWAAEYSFFIAFPTIIAATGVQALSIWRKGGLDELPIVPLSVGFIVAAIVGIGALYLVLHLLYRARFRYFSYYVWCLAVVVLFAGWRGIL